VVVAAAAAVAAVVVIIPVCSNHLLRFHPFVNRITSISLLLVKYISLVRAWPSYD
jgi:hypothetical protein